MVRYGIIALLLAGCGRATGTYDVQVYGEGTRLDQVLPPAEPMVGVVEYSRTRIWGSNLGLGFVGAPGDQPRADGSTVVVGSASFSYPADPSFARASAMVSPGPVVLDRCLTRITERSLPGSGELVDVGDRIDLRAGADLHVRLERDPSVYPRPAGDAWWLGYGGQLMADIQGHDLLPDTWRSGTDLDVSFPGGITPESSTLGSVPAPAEGLTLRLPSAVEGLTLGGEAVRAPQHSDEADDVVRFAGPWSEPIELRWTPAEPAENLTLSLRVLAVGVEAPCACEEDCGPGFTCEEGACVTDEGATWNQVGEVVCTVVDDGEFTLQPEQVADLGAWGAGSAGAMLLVSRISQGEGEIPPILTWSGKRVDETTIRTRGIDTVVTRLEAPPE